jgi:diguanylate cyclase (GGDEF)-like protein/PAS domain S-box-containing protein
MGVNAITFLLLATVVRQRRRIANEIHESEIRYRDLFENVSDMVHSIAPDGSVLFANRAWRDALGYTEDDLKTLNLFSVIHPDEIDRCRSHLQRMTAGEDIGRIETKFVTKDGKTITVEGQSNCRVENGVAVCTRAIFRDVTENRQQMRQLELARRELQETAAKLSRVATTDALTSVHNRASFQKRLEEEISRGRRYATPLSLLMIDVDHFKQYNDTFGHAEGDKALQAVAKLLRDIARGTDIVARYGGEEFSVILPHTDVDGAIAVAERVRKVIEEHTWTKRAVTASIGAATLGDSDLDGMKMIKQADAAMYRSKRTGRNRAVHAKLLLDD